VTDPWVAQKYGLVAEINMIPLIDVSLVLLVIFMVLTPVLIRSQIKVSVPEAETAEVSTRDAASIVVQIDGSGQVWIEGVRVGAEDLNSTLKAVLQGRGDDLVILEADKGVAFQSVVSVLDASTKGGAKRLAVAALTE
jgi:biopolymer transport protein TolR